MHSRRGVLRTECGERDTKSANMHRSGCHALTHAPDAGCHTFTHAPPRGANAWHPAHRKVTKRAHVQLHARILAVEARNTAHICATSTHHGSASQGIDSVAVTAMDKQHRPKGGEGTTRECLLRARWAHLHAHFPVGCAKAEAVGLGGRQGRRDFRISGKLGRRSHLSLDSFALRAHLGARGVRENAVGCHVHGSKGSQGHTAPRHSQCTRRECHGETVEVSPTRGDS